MEKKYLRKLGVFKVTIDNVALKTNDETGIKKLVFTLVDNEQRYIDASYKMPLNDWAGKQVRNLMSILGVGKPGETKGKQVAVVVAPNKWKDKIYWNPQGFFESRWLDVASEAPEDLDSLGLGDDLGGLDASMKSAAGGSDEIVF